MGRKPQRGRGDDAAPRSSIKLSFRVSLDLAQRLGIEAAMRRVSQSAIVAEALGAHLKTYRLPSRLGGPAAQVPDGVVHGDDGG